MLRILLVAPETGLQTQAEVRDLTSVHRVTVLSETVSARDVYQAARAGYDVIHYSTHSDEFRVVLSGKEELLDHDLLQIARIAGLKCNVFNSCHAGRLAHYLVGHDVPLAVHTNRALPDADAWKFPLAFYSAIERLGNTHSEAYVRAFASASDSEGLYGLAIAPDLALRWAMQRSEEPERKPLTPRQWLLMGGVTLAVIWLLVLSALMAMGG